MKKIVDQYNGDPTFSYLHDAVASNEEVREVLKTASFEEKKAEVARLPAHAFAWEDERRFPVHTPEDTVASVLYREKLNSYVPRQVDDKLAKAVDMFSLHNVLVTLQKTAAVAQPATNLSYALPLEQRLPMHNAVTVKMAERVLLSDYKYLPLLKRAEAFSNVYQAAKKHDVELKPISMKLAGATECDTTFVTDWLDARTAASVGAVSESFDKLATAFRGKPGLIDDRDSLVKLAATIQALDEKAGLEKYYDNKLPDPLLTVFNTDKVATETCDVAGLAVPCDQLMSLDPQVWDQVGMPEIAEVAQSGDVAVFKQVFDTVPMDIKVVLKAQLGG